MMLAAFGAILLLVGFYSAWRAIRYAKNGTAFVISDVSGRGVAWPAERKAGSAWFWFVFAGQILASLAAGAAGALLLFRNAI